MRMRRLWMVDPVWDPVSIRLYFWMFPPAPAFDSCPSVADAVAVLIDVNESVEGTRKAIGPLSSNWPQIFNSPPPPPPPPHLPTLSITGLSFKFHPIICYHHLDAWMMAGDGCSHRPLGGAGVGRFPPSASPAASTVHRRPPPGSSRLKESPKHLPSISQASPKHL